MTTSALAEVRSLLAREDAFDIPYSELLPLQLAAATELLVKLRGRVPLLERRASEAGITGLASVQDATKLLMPHTAYKSYPQAFLQKGNWKGLLQWARTVGSIPSKDINLDGVSNLDQWIARMWEAGNRLTITSGTSGKPSILNANLEDHERLSFVMKHITGDTQHVRVKADQSRHYFQCLPKQGPYTVNVMGNCIAEHFCRPDSCHYISDEPLTVAQISRSIEIRQAMAAGTLSPEALAAFEAETANRQQQMDASMNRMVDKLAAVRHEPLYLMGVWPQVWQFVQRMRERGIQPGEFHPDSVIAAGGGRKGAVMPDDFEEQIIKFLNPNIYRNHGYGMSEMMGSYKGCEAGRYHFLPTSLTCLMDDDGLNVLEQKGVVTGRFAFIDLNLEGRWGGLITGDKVTIDFESQCACGRRGPTILPNIARYRDLGDDKIGCAGTVDAYISGALA